MGDEEEAMKVIFLDREGVINKYPGDTRYVTALSEFHFLPGVKRALKRLTEAGYKIFIISNQAGVTKGIYSKETLDEITSNMLNELNGSGVKICEVYYCIHRDEDNCSCRKPKIGSIEKASKEHDIPFNILSNSFFIGDSTRDVQTGKSAGCRTILVFSGKEKPEGFSSLGTVPFKIQPDFTARDLSEAVDLILGTPVKPKGHSF